ncbi:hypothetical protein Pfo_003401 [Paulownia fortunei]|nr:hypothetical protein Pfo_003401 [Paulownia fortunei]
MEIYQGAVELNKLKSMEEKSTVNKLGKAPCHSIPSSIRKIRKDISQVWQKVAMSVFR